MAHLSGRDCWCDVSTSWNTHQRIGVQHPEKIRCLDVRKDRRQSMGSERLLISLGYPWHHGTMDTFFSTGTCPIEDSWNEVNQRLGYLIFFKVLCKPKMMRNCFPRHPCRMLWSQGKRRKRHWRTLPWLRLALLLSVLSSLCTTLGGLNPKLLAGACSFLKLHPHILTQVCLTHTHLLVAWFVKVCRKI